MTEKEIGLRGSGVRAPCVKMVRESDEWKNTVTSSQVKFFKRNKGWVDGVS